jgi:HEAT repeat protein
MRYSYEPDFEGLFYILENGKQSDRAYALKHLATAKHDDIFEILLDSFVNDEGIDVKNTAFNFLEKYLPDERLISPLQEIVAGGENDWVAKRAAEWLVKLNAFNLPLLLRSLGNSWTDDIITEQLAAYGAAAVEPLIDIIRDSDNDEIRSSAIEALTKIPDRRIVQPLYNLLTKPKEDVNVRGFSAIALGQFSNKLISSTLQAIYLSSQEDVYLRATTLKALVNQNPVEATPLVLQALHAPDLVRITAVYMLEKLDLPNKKELYSAALKDPAQSIRHIAAHAIARNGWTDLLDELKQTFLLEKADIWNTEFLAGYIFQLGGEQAANWLLAQMDTVELWITRKAIIQALSKVDDNQVFEPLFALLEKYRLISEEETMFLAKHRAKVIPHLLGLLKDTNEDLRKWAYWHLGQLGAEEATDILLAMLDNPVYSDTEKREIIWALGGVGDERALPKLAELRDSENKNIAGNAYEEFLTISCRVYGKRKQDTK